MKLKISNLILGIALAMGGGLYGTYFFATWETLARPLRDCTSMVMLLTSLLISGFLIVITLIKIGESRSPSL
ncbi:MAG: hypothetical protein ACE5EK_03120 [Nitrospinales bacterium]